MRALDFAPRGRGAFKFSSVAPVMQDHVEQEHKDENAAEGDDDGRTGRRIHLHAEIYPESGDECTHGPSNGKAWTDSISEKHGSNAGHN
jgi:hypothetical protein